MGACSSKDDSEQVELKSTPQDAVGTDPEDIDFVESTDDMAEVQHKLTKRYTQKDFKLLKTVGKGSFGRVFMVSRNSDNKIFAMKVLNKQKLIERNQYEHTLSERKILEDIDHPFLVGLRCSFQSPTKLFMVFDFFNGGELYSYVSRGRFSESRARFYSGEIVLAIEHLHSHSIVYRDLKPENLLLDREGHIKLCDFGLCKEDVTGDTIKTICGTPEYLAPEVLQHKTYGKSVDWWSLGNVMFEMIAGLPPFFDNNRQIMFRKILQAPLFKPRVMSEDAFTLITGMLNRTPQQRWGYEGADKIRNAAWFRAEQWGPNWDDLYHKKVTPPFKPKVKGEMDVSRVDAAFLNEAAVITPTPHNAVLVSKDAFKDFTFAESSGISLSETGEENFSWTPPLRRKAR